MRDRERSRFSSTVATVAYAVGDGRRGLAGDGLRGVQLPDLGIGGDESLGVLRRCVPKHCIIIIITISCLHAGKGSITLCVCVCGVLSERHNLNYGTNLFCKLIYDIVGKKRDVFLYSTRH